MYKHYPYDDVEDGCVASSSECTGLIPMTPDYFDSMDSYADMYDIPVPKNCTNRRKTMNNQNSNKSQNTDKYSNKKDSNQNSNKKESNSNSNRKDY